MGFWKGGGGGVEPDQIFKKEGRGGRGGEGLTGSQFLEGVAGKEGVIYFQGVPVFT